MTPPDIFPLEGRTYLFARRCRDFTRQLPETPENREYIKQLLRSSGSQAANYIEANESLSKKDFCHRIKIALKETKESALWIRLCNCGSNKSLEDLQEKLLQEALELRKIFSAIFIKVHRTKQS